MAQDEPPVAELLRELSEQTSTLVHQEFAKGSAEVKTDELTATGILIGKRRT